MKITASINNVKSKIRRPFSFLSIKATPVPRSLASNTNLSYATIQDKNFIAYPLGLMVNDYQLSLVTVGDFTNKQAVWSSSDTSVATVDSTGYVSYVSDGSCSISCVFNEQVKSISLNFFSQYITSNYTFSDYVTNSLAKYLKTNIDSMVSGKNATTKKNIFLIQDHTNNIYIRNSDCWAYGYDLSAISPWNSDAGYMMSGTLISPRHVLFCKHVSFYPAVNSTIRFVNLNNQVITRTLTNILPIDSTNFYPDFTIGLLDSDATTQNQTSTGVSFAKVLPANWYSYLPSLAANTSGTYTITDSLPVMYTDQEEKCLLAHWLRVAGSNPNLQAVEPAIPSHRELFETAIRFDSGNPVFVMINNQLVILSVLTTSIGGSYVSAYLSTINNAMNQLGGGYQLTTVDLSNFIAF
jgi:hypothetical protein